MRPALALLLMLGCATVRSTYEESSECPVVMTEEQHASGVVRCRALCSSYARDFSSYDTDCKCRCRPAGRRAQATAPSNQL
ncbi:MAG: hypothetical protein EPN91_08825 [Salinibacterium sp.]|nr:MAG: hypothetical protein EPN91_08825 [Salinibacterium sp.]